MSTPLATTVHPPSHLGTPDWSLIDDFPVPPSVTEHSRRHCWDKAKLYGASSLARGDCQHANGHLLPWL